jgi:hypothetical protein
MRLIQSMLIYSLFLLITASTESYSSVLNDFENALINKLSSSTNSNFFNLTKYISSRRGGSFGGFRGMRSRPRTRSATRATTRNTNPQKTPSFGGKRMSPQAAQAKYGTPRRVQSMPGTNAAGAPVNYNVHHYGGFSSSLMSGYMMGNMVWWMVVPSMLYSRPIYVEKGDGKIDVYPPTFDWGKLFTFVLIIGAIAFFLSSSRRAKNNTKSNYSSSSFS